MKASFHSLACCRCHKSKPRATPRRRCFSFKIGPEMTSLSAAPSPCFILRYASHGSRRASAETPRAARPRRGASHCRKIPPCRAVTGRSPRLEVSALFIGPRRGPAVAAIASRNGQDVRQAWRCAASARRGRRLYSDRAAHSLSGDKLVTLLGGAWGNRVRVAALCLCMPNNDTRRTTPEDAGQRRAEERGSSRK